MPKVAAKKPVSAEVVEKGATEKKPIVKKLPKKLGKRVLGPIVYDKFTYKVVSITYEMAKKLLGWEVVLTGDYVVKDRADNMIRCKNNLTNRPFSLPDAEKIRQEILNKRWKLNGETIIIGNRGSVLSGQHRLIGLILAYLDWERNTIGDENFDMKEVFGNEPPTLETLVVYGVDEGDDTVNTIDTGKTRSLSDVIYRSEIFASVKPSDRKALARILDYAVRTVWERTGAQDAFSKYRTHAESLNFIERHPKLVDCSQHIFQENGGSDNKIQRVVNSLGTAAGLMYLMGSSSSNSEDYFGSDVRNEKSLNWSMWDKAETFWVELATHNKANALWQVRVLIDKLINRIDKDGFADPIRVKEREAIIVKAWNLYADGKDITMKSLELEYEKDEDGTQHLAETPVVGGIDLGDAKNTEAEVDPEVTPDHIAKEKAEIRKEKEAGKVDDAKKAATKKPAAGATPKAAVKKPAQTNGKFKKGDSLWVSQNGQVPWCGTVISCDNKFATLKVQTGHQGAGMVRNQIPLTICTVQQPRMPEDAE
jgi:hypothetical protein